MPFAQWLQNKISQHGFTNYRIAKMAGVHQSTVANWLSGAKPQAEKEKLVRQAISEYEESILGENNMVSHLLDEERAKHDPGIKKDPATMGGEMTDTKREAWELIQSWDDEKLKKFIAAAKAMLGE